MGADEEERGGVVDAQGLPKQRGAVDRIAVLPHQVQAEHNRPEQ